MTGCRYVDIAGVPRVRRACGECVPRFIGAASLTPRVPQLLKHKEEFIELLQLLIDKTKSERGYSGTGRLLHRILHTVAAVYPTNARFVNSDEWDDPGELRQGA